MSAISSKRYRRERSLMGFDPAAKSKSYFLSVTSPRRFGTAGFSHRFVHWQKVAIFAAMHKAFGHRFEFLPAPSNILCLCFGDLIVGGRGGDDSKEVGEFL